MKKRYGVLIIILLAVEASIFLYFFIAGSRGLWVLAERRRECDVTACKAEALGEEVRMLRKQIDDLQRYPWYKEQIAREELQLQYPDEEVFLIE